jgi:hypothetical protein
MESKNILIRWYEDGFPPIDLNSQAQAVVWLIREYRSLQKDCNIVKQTVTSKINRIAELEAELAALRGQKNVEIPEWIIKYDQSNHQSSAGKAIRHLLGLLTPAPPQTQTKEQK